MHGTKHDTCVLKVYVCECKNVQLLHPVYARLQLACAHVYTSLQHTFTVNVSKPAYSSGGF